MTALGVIVMWVGLILALVGGIAFIIAAFRESLLWGLGVLFLPFVSLVFLILHWQSAKRPFFLQLWGLAFAVLAVVLLGARLPHH